MYMLHVFTTVLSLIKQCYKISQTSYGIKHEKGMLAKRLNASVKLKPVG